MPLLLFWPLSLDIRTLTNAAAGTLITLALLFSLASCSPSDKVSPTGIIADAAGHTAPSAYTAEINRQVLEQLPFSNREDFEQAQRGLIAKPESLVVKNAQGAIIWDQTAYEFINGEAPASVNPSLWRQAKLNGIHGLFKVTDGIYQLRGFDIANMTIIEGQSGWIIVDPLTSIETASMAIAFAREHLGNQPITAVLFTHSHVDHFAGVLGLFEPWPGKSEHASQTDLSNIQIIAPKGFMHESLQENILAGPTMVRRASFMYGLALAKSARGHVDTGLGKALANGTTGILEPTVLIDHTGQRLTIDGVPFVFQNVSGSEAPAEFTFYLPEQEAFCGAELLSRNMHNLYTLRGAKVRDALAWSAYIDEAKNLFSEATVYFASHHWPIWGREKIAEFMEVQRDTYKYLHDQTLRLAFKGYTPKEIAETVQLPRSLQKTFSNRGYYGTAHHNSRAVYQAYYGWFDGNPANLNPLPPVDAGKHYVAAMGGAERVMEQAQAAFDKGEYRWAAQLLNHLVFADNNHLAAKNLLANTYDQLGYQAESGPWRDIYLTGAYELRHGAPGAGKDLSDARNMIKHSPLANFFTVMAAQLNGPKAEGLEMTINFHFTDLDETHVLTLKNAVLHHRQLTHTDNDIHNNNKANATLNITHNLFLDIVLGSADIKQLLLSDQLSIDGSIIDLAKFFSLQDKSNGNFAIVTP